MEPNLTNAGEEKVRLAWKGFIYELEPGESKWFPSSVYNALTKRFSDLKPYKKKIRKGERLSNVRENTLFVGELPTQE